MNIIKVFKKNEKKLLFLLILIFIFHFLFRVYSYKSEYLSKFDPDYWEGRYLKSQWVMSDSKETIGDDGLYAYAGWKYINGEDPTKINTEMPPFGKYLIGLSIIIFKNQNIFALLNGLLVLFLLYKFNFEITKNNVLSLLPVILFSFEPLFYTQIRAPFLDLLYLNLLILTFLFFLKKKYILASVFLGLTMATKSSLSTFLLIISALFIYTVLIKNQAWLKNYFLIPIIALTTFTITYLKFFLNGHSFLEFLKVQKWIINFYSTGAKGNFGEIWNMILTGSWHTWWGETIRINEWQISWPIIFILTLAYIFMKIYKRIFDETLILILWVVFYVAFLSFIPSFPRYLLSLLPFMYNFSVWSFSKSTFSKYLR